MHGLLRLVTLTWFYGYYCANSVKLIFYYFHEVFCFTDSRSGWVFLYYIYTLKHAHRRVEQVHYTLCLLIISFKASNIIKPYKNIDFFQKFWYEKKWKKWQKMVKPFNNFFLLMISGLSYQLQLDNCLELLKQI